MQKLQLTNKYTNNKTLIQLIQSRTYRLIESQIQANYNDGNNKKTIDKSLKLTKERLK